MKNYIKPELEVISIFAEENIASSGVDLLSNNDDKSSKGGSSVYVDGWNIWG